MRQKKKTTQQKTSHRTCFRIFFADVFFPLSGIEGTRIEMEDFWLHRNLHTYNQNRENHCCTLNNFGGTRLHHLEC
jgi:hypothetical protein